jgi:tetratricopeptide (TPR) repeat protein
MGGGVADAVFLAAELDAARGDGKAALRRLAARELVGSDGKREDLARVIRTLAERGDLAHAVDAARLGARWFPADAQFPYYAGGILLSSGRPADAAEALEEAKRLEPDNLLIRGLFALSLARSGRPEAAVREARSVLRIDPENAEARAVLDQAGSAEEPSGGSAGN